MARKGAKEGGLASVLRSLDEQRSAKLRAKLPHWAEAQIHIPSGLSLEQCSSEATALYKASVAQALTGGEGSIADLTGGLGVDSWALSRVCARLLYFERNEELCSAAMANFRELGCSNISCFNQESSLSSLEKLPEMSLIYIDPARRSASGSKVFLLEECTPDVLTLLSAMCRKAAWIMIKLSPMADITMVVRRLQEAAPEGYGVRQLHLVGAEGEVKELLVLLGRGSGSWTLTLADCGSGARLQLSPEDEKRAQLALSNCLNAGTVLLEPRPLLLKAGLRKLPCSLAGLRKLSQDCHLYTGSLPEDHPLTPFFKQYEILETLPTGNASIKELGRKYPVAEVSARGLHMSSEELRRKIGCKSGIAPDGRHYHIFGCGTALGGRLIVCCRK